MAGTARQARTVEEKRAAEQRQRVKRIKAQIKEVRSSEHDDYTVEIQETGETKVLTRAEVEATLKGNLAKARKRLHELEWAAVNGHDESGGNGIYLARSARAGEDGDPMAMRTITMLEAEEKARVERSEAWLALNQLLLGAAQAGALEETESQSTIVDWRRAHEQSAAPEAA